MRSGLNVVIISLRFLRIYLQNIIHGGGVITSGRLSPLILTNDGRHGGSVAT